MKRMLSMSRNHQRLSVVNNERGVALLVTLSIMAIVLATAFSLHRTIFSHRAARRAALYNIQIEALLTSAQQAAMALLIDDKKKSRIDSLQESWADSETIANTIKMMAFEAGKLDYTIEDELGRIQINALVQYPQGRHFNQKQVLLWERLLEDFKSSEIVFANVESMTIINSLKDWLDFGDGEAITGLSGAESDYYEFLEPPYTCRNGPIQHISELLLIRGMDETLYSGVEDQPGLSHHLTIHGMSGENGALSFAGKINLNTASERVIRALLPEEQASLAKVIVDYRDEKSEGQFVNTISSPVWYKKVPGAGNVTIPSSLVTQVSDLFRIRMVAELNGYHKGVMVVVRREKMPETGEWVCQVIRRENDPASPVVMQRRSEINE